MADDLFSWLRALHIVAVIAWMAGMLYLPRLFVYHVSAEKGSELSETLKKMEGRLLWIIVNPAMVLSVGLGCALLSEPEAIQWDSDIWIYTKLVFVLFLMGLHVLLIRWQRAFSEDRNQHTKRFFRIMNEGPTVLMLGIVILVVIKPF